MSNRFPCRIFLSFWFLSGFSVWNILGTGWEKAILKSIPILIYEENGHQEDSNVLWNAVTTGNNDDDKKKYDYPFTFGACLMTRDDTMILPEWLAYHYTALPLRHLIVAVDPLSITSPAPILDAFRNDTDMTIDMWTGNFYFSDKKMFDSFDPKRHQTSLRQDMLNFHRTRQRSFFTKCLQTYKQNHLEIQWIILMDSDEYLTFNPLLPVEVAEQQKSGKPASSRSTDWRVVNATRFRQTLPTKIGRQNETIAHWMSKHPDYQFPNINQSLCIAYPRLFFSAFQERSPDELQEIITSQSSLLSSSWISNQSLHTLRFPGHWPHRNSIPVKSLVNLHNYDGVRKVLNPHRPFKGDCTGYAFASVMGHSPFRIHHYSGALETFLLRPSRNEELWRQRNNYAIEGADDSMTEWLAWFVKIVGEETARRLIVDTVDLARQEWLDIKQRVELHNESIAPIFEWDQPATGPKIANS